MTHSVTEGGKMAIKLVNIKVPLHPKLVEHLDSPRFSWVGVTREEVIRFYLTEAINSRLEEDSRISALKLRQLRSAT